jgi:ribosomal protein L3 glutamine methyltransferase
MSVTQSSKHGIELRGGGELSDELVTIRDWLRWSVSRFNAAKLSYGHGTSNALDEAAFLILETLHLGPDQLEPWLDARLTLPERHAVQSIVERRIATRKPASYLTGSAYIQGHRFFVDERVIVPRSFIGELLCEGRLDDLVPDGGSTILDLCTGSGCLAILAALRFPEALIHAVELSPEAAGVARANIAAYEVQERVKLFEGDLFEPVGKQNYDLIIANPPYVAAAEVAAFPEEYKAEPEMAHIGGADGLDLARKILAAAPDHLTATGSLVMEIGTGRHILEAEFPRLPFIWLDTEESEGEVLTISAGDLAGQARRSKRKN